MEKKKKSLHKFTHIHLLKNDVQSKQKFDKHRKKKNHPNLLKNNNHVKKKKKSRLFLPKKNQKTKNKSNQITVNPHPKEKKKRQSVPRKQKINQIK